MKDFTIDITALSNNGNAAYASQAYGTLSPRPIVSGASRKMSVPEIFYTALLQALKDIGPFLSEGDIVEARFDSPSQSAQAMISKGSGIAHLDNAVKELTRTLSRKGIGLSIVPAKERNTSVVHRASMAMTLGV